MLEQMEEFMVNGVGLINWRMPTPNEIKIKHFIFIIRHRRAALPGDGEIFHNGDGLEFGFLQQWHGIFPEFGGEDFAVEIELFFVRPYGGIATHFPTRGRV